MNWWCVNFCFVFVFLLEEFLLAVSECSSECFLYGGLFVTPSQ